MPPIAITHPSGSTTLLAYPRRYVRLDVGLEDAVLPLRVMTLAAAVAVAPLV